MLGSGTKDDVAEIFKQMVSALHLTVHVPATPMLQPYGVGLYIHQA